MPIVTRRWHRPVAFHLLVPVAAALPFFAFRLLLNGTLTGRFPDVVELASKWRWIGAMETPAIYPIYWLLLAAATVLEVQRDGEARQVQAVQMERSLADAQLDALRMKLQPHFLFNTLNAIGVLAQQGDTDDVVQTVEHLGTLLRLSMETGGRQFVALEEELRQVDAYLAIEAIRHKDRLVVARTIDPAVSGAPVPSLILQPLVEHAVCHGLEGRIDPTTITIEARPSAGGVEIQVSDDGPGHPVGWMPAAGAGHGLDVVAERLAALYGARGRLEVGPRETGGTVSRLSLPAAPAFGGSVAWTA